MKVKITGRPDRQGLADLVRLGEVKGDIIVFRNTDEPPYGGKINEEEFLDIDVYNHTIVEKFEVEFDGASIRYDDDLIIEFDEDLDYEDREETIESIKNIVFGDERHIESVNKKFV